MYRYSLNVPTCLNDGTPVDPADVDLIESRLLDIAGGFTVTHGIGAWRGEDRTYREPVAVYVIDTPREPLDALRQLAEYVALALDQEAVYFTRLPILAAELVHAPAPFPA